MDVQTTRSTKALLTHCAIERLLSCMGPEVGEKMVLPIKLLFADCALEGLLFRMCLEMSVEI